MGLELQLRAAFRRETSPEEMNSDQTKFGTEISRRTAEARLAECKTQRGPKKAARKRGGPKAGPAPKRRKIKNPDAMDSDDEFFPPEGGALPKRKKLKPKLKRKKPKQKPKPKPVKRKKKPKTDKKQNQRESNRFSKRRTKQTQLVERLKTQSQHDSKSPSFGKRLRREGDYAQAN